MKKYKYFIFQPIKFLYEIFKGRFFYKDLILIKSFVIQIIKLLYKLNKEE